MQDLFRNYHKHKVLSNISIIGMSFLLAISINVLLSGNQPTQALKASVIDASQNVSISDLSINVEGNNLSLVSNKDMQEVTELSLSLAYDPESMSLQEAQSSLTESIVDIENESGFKTLVMSFESPVSISSGDSILTLIGEKETDTTTYVNMIQTNFTDSSGEVFLLSSSGIVY